jgi:hypothetical protein
MDRTAYYYNVKTRQRSETMPKGFDELQREIAYVAAACLGTLDCDVPVYV